MLREKNKVKWITSFKNNIFPKQYSTKALEDPNLIFPKDKFLKSIPKVIQ